MSDEGKLSMPDDIHDPYAWWRQALANVASGKPVPSVSADHPECGRYRRRLAKGGPWVPVALWQDHGKWHCIVGLEPRDAMTEWLWLAKNPVSEADYHHRITTGHWPGEFPPIGDNRPSDPYEALVSDIKQEILSAAEWLATAKIANQHEADIAGNKIGSMRELAAKAKSSHKEEKEPHLRAGQAVDARYNPLIAELTEAAQKIKNAVAIWAAAETRKREDEARKIEAERARIEAENRKREIEAAKANAPPPTPLFVPEQVEVKRVQIGGAVGRKVGFKNVESVIITDYTKALKRYKDRSEVMALILELCNRDFKASNVVPPFCELKEEVKTA